jgi:hypothetical protein
LNAISKNSILMSQEEELSWREAMILARLRAKKKREREERHRRVEHQVRLRRRQIDAEVRADAIKRQLADLEAARTRLRRAEERATVADLEYAMSVYRGPVLRGTGSMPVDVARRWLRVRVEPGAPEIPAFRADIDRLAAGLKATVRYDVSVPVNAYAWQARREVELQRPVSEEALATDGHELGHIAKPCEPTHTLVPRSTGPGSLCVACELAAWRWAALHLCRWTRAMHIQMASSLSTYKPYATEAERQQIDALCSRRGFHELCLIRATR